MLRHRTRGGDNTRKKLLASASPSKNDPPPNVKFGFSVSRIPHAILSHHIPPDCDCNLRDVIFSPPASQA
jgi:hypothetical protein